MNRKDGADAVGRLRKLWNNYVVRNLVLAVSLLVIVLFLVSVSLNLFTRHNRYRSVPDFSDMTVAEAVRVASSDRLRIEINDSLYLPELDPGVILDQRPAPAAQVKPGRRIYVTINASQPRIIDVPYVAGYSLRQARNILETAGLEIDKLVYVSDIATNNVIEQRVEGRIVRPDRPMRTRMGNGATLTVGKAPGAARVTVPRVVGLTLHDARSRLVDAGLNPGRTVVEGDDDPLRRRQARVYRQVPEQGSRVELGTAVTLTLSTDSLTVHSGMSASDKQGVRAANRESALRDSLVKSGLGGDELQRELEWALRVADGEVRPEDKPVPAEQAILESLDEYGAGIADGNGGDAADDDEFFY